MDKINKLILPATILIASLILGGFFYASQVNKQRSIEKQDKAKAEQEKKEYVAKRKNECYSIYEKERDEWSNVKGIKYSEVRDICIVKYKSAEPAKNEEVCEKIIKGIGEMDLPEGIIDGVTQEYFDCLENVFSKEF